MQNLDDYLCLDDIMCYDADGKPFEQYPKLWVKKDLERDDKGNILKFASYEGAAYFEKQGLLKPSFALTCAIIQSLYQNRSDPEAAKLLAMYKEGDPKSGSGLHGTNTVIRWKKDGTASIVHYPKDEDYTIKTKPFFDRFTVGTWDINTGMVHYPKGEGPKQLFLQFGGNSRINMGRKRAEFPFLYWYHDYYWSDVYGPYDSTLEEALQKPKFERFIKNLTGLRRPELLIEVANYFGQPAYVHCQPRWVESASDTVTGTSMGSSDKHPYEVSPKQFFMLMCMSYLCTGEGNPAPEGDPARAVRTKGAMQAIVHKFQYASRKYQGIKAFFEYTQKQLLKK